MFFIADLITYAATPLNKPKWCNLTKCFNIVTSPSSHSTLPDDGDHTETYWSYSNFYVNFNVL